MGRHLILAGLLLAASALDGCKAAKAPTPSPEQLAETPTPSLGQASKTPTPSPGQASKTPIPSHNQASKNSKPSHNQVAQTPTPSPGQASKTPTPSHNQASKTRTLSPEQGPATLASFAPATLVAGTRIQDPSEHRWSWHPRMEGEDARLSKLSQPYMAAGDSRGRVYIADKKGHALRMVDEAGLIHTVAGTGHAGNGADAKGPGTRCALDHPNALWVAPSDRVYVLDLGNAKLRRYDPSGHMQTVAHFPTGLQSGRGLVLDANERVAYISSKSKILRWEQGGETFEYASGFENLAHLALSPSGELYAADRGANLVYRIDGPQDKTVIAGNGSSLAQRTQGPARSRGLDAPRALVLLPDQSLLIGTQSGKRIYRLDPDGQLQRWLDPQEQAPLALSLGSLEAQKLRGLSLTPQGQILLTQGDRGQVLRFAPM